ncbi:MAG: hypothetical protein ACR2PR_00090 [Pseudohongiellaceae bacterium]
MNRQLPFFSALAFTLILALLPFRVFAQSSVAAPEELLQWQDWIAEQHPDINCPWLATTGNRQICAWPTSLVLDVNDEGAAFTQSWNVFHDGWLQLPGDQLHWPEAETATLNDTPVPVIERNNHPVIPVTPGLYTITGNVAWDAIPQSLQVPPQTALIALTLNGETITWPNVDGQGNILFSPQQGGTDERITDSVQVEVFRLISDGVPLTMRSVVELSVAGQPRELLLGRLLPEDSEIMAFESSLPARVEADGMLRVQVRAGSWEVMLDSRFTEPVEQLSMTRLSDNWPTQEIWSFRHDPLLRGVSIEGVPSIDPSQIDLPVDWEEYNTWLINESATMQLVEEYRGDIAPTANVLNLDRVVWLDFDGRGATVRDILTGEMHQGWRLSGHDNISLGRVAVNGIPELVTRLADNGESGVEVRESQFIVEALSRVDSISGLNGIGWQHDVDSLTVRLNLPPGWKLWYVSGADRVSNAWLSDWNLWDIFLCLLIIGAIARLFNWQWAAVAAATLALTYQEAGTVLLSSWISFIIILPLLRVLPTGRSRNFVQRVGYLALAGLALLILSFSIYQVQSSLFPQLERAGFINAAGSEREQVTLARVAPVTAESEAVMTDAMFAAERTATDYSYRTGDNIQTGPGQPTWRWHIAELDWAGPVQADVPLRLYVTPPLLNRLLNLLRVVLVTMLAFALGRELLHQGGYQLPNYRRSGSSSGQGTAASLLLAISALAAAGISLAPQPAEAQDFPPEHLLRELERRLLEPPQCIPDCMAINSALITVTDNRMLMRLRIDSSDEIAVPLNLDSSWQIQNIQVDGAPAAAAVRDDTTLWLMVNAGRHDITLDSTLNGDAINLAFPTNIHNITVDAEGWQVFGLTGNRLPGRSLQLQRQTQEASGDNLLPDPIAPFIRITRHARLDNDWSLDTTIERLAPEVGGITINVPLANGESILNENIQLIENENGRFAVATLAPTEDTVVWSSRLELDGQLLFTADAGNNYVEEWLVEASTRWHITADGLPPVKPGPNYNPAIPRWLPWPGETITINAERPQPVAGPTITVENVRVNTVPGARLMDTTMTLDIRSSLGGEFLISQPPDAELQQLRIDGEQTTQQVENNQVSVPLTPGLQTVQLRWSIPGNLGIVSRMPEFTLSTPATNIDLSMRMPYSRWILYATGPAIGPAFLYWGVLVVAILIALGLGRFTARLGSPANSATPNIPVSTWQWMLLLLGTSTINMQSAIPMVAWFFIMYARSRLSLLERWPNERGYYNLVQTGLVLFTAIAVITLALTIPQSLLAVPDMLVTGNGSNNYLYRWYQDNSGQTLPVGQVFSLPLWFYRLAMLLWSIWLVFALLKWSAWGWRCFSKELIWRGKLKSTS